MEQALKYLAETDERAGILKALIAGYELDMKVVEAEGIIANTGKGNVEHVKALARSSDKYKELVRKLHDTMYDYEIIAAKRRTEEIVFEAWRSVNSNRRQGIAT